MKKVLRSLSALLVLVSLTGIGASASHRKPEAYKTRVAKVAKSSKSSFTATADIRIEMTKAPTVKYLGINNKQAMYMFNKSWSLNQMKRYIGKNSNFNYRKATKRFISLVKGYQKANTKHEPRTYKLYY